MDRGVRGLLWFEIDRNFDNVRLTVRVRKGYASVRVYVHTCMVMPSYGVCKNVVHTALCFPLLIRN